MCDAGEAVNSRFSERSVNEKAVVMADKGEGYHAYSFENPRVDNNGATQLSLQFRRDAEGLGDDGHDNDGHADQGETAGFGKL